MSTRNILLRIVLSALFILAFGAGLGYAQQPDNPDGVSATLGSAFTYQGQLKKAGLPVTAICDFEFRLYNSASGVSQIGPLESKTGIGVIGGLFSVTLDFGSGAFNGEGRWLGIQVKCSSDEGYTDLGRQELTPTPMALALPGLWVQQNGTSPNLIGGSSTNWITSGVYGATISGGGQYGSPNYVLDHFGTVGGGDTNQAGNLDDDLTNASFATVGGGTGNQASALYATIGGGANNRASASYSTVCGGYNNQASGLGAFVAGGSSSQASGVDAVVGGGTLNQASGDYATVPGGMSNEAIGNYSFAAGFRAKANHPGAFVWGDVTLADITSTAMNTFLVRASNGITLTVESGALRLLPTVTSPNLIGGYSGNSITSGVYGATISGGGQSLGLANHITDHHGTIGGGKQNQAGSNDTTLDNAMYATVGGGYGNQATAENATVSGGDNNRASAPAATVSGGVDHETSGWYSTVPGGANNHAAGILSFAAGFRARANHDGSFVWSDFNGFDFASTADNQFNVRATGGARFVLAIDGTSGDPTWTCSAVDGSSWACSSDRALKENLVLAEPQQTLQQLAQVPVYYWNAKGGGARHIGPMAQDFAAAFAVGENNTSLATIDLDGVALAAIQGLYQRSKELEAENAGLHQQAQHLQAENAELRQQMEDLDQRLAALEQGSDAARLPQVNQADTWLLLAGLGLAGMVFWRRSHMRGGQT